MASTRINWREVPCVELELPRIPKANCPRCGSVDHQFVRSLRGEGDGSSSRYMLCRDCHCPFIILAFFADDDDE